MTTTNKTVLAAKEEVAEGVAETLASTDTFEHINYGKIDPNWEDIERDRAGGTLTRGALVAGRRSGTVEIPMELAGGSAGSGAKPNWSIFMKASGMKETAVKVIRMAATFTTGNSFRHGDKLEFFETTGPVSMGHGRCVGDFNQGDLWLAVEVSDGTQDWADPGDTTWAVDQTTDYVEVDGGAGNECPLHADNDTENLDPYDGWMYEPWDLYTRKIALDQTFVNLAVAAGDIIVGASSGARAMVTEAIGAGAASAADVVFERWLGSAAFVQPEDIDDTAGVKQLQVAAGATEQAHQLPSLTIATQLPGLQQLLSGCRGNWAANIQNGQNGSLTFTMQGKSLAPSEVAPFFGSSVPFNKTQAPPTVIGSSINFGGTWVPGLSQLQLSSTSTVTLRESIADASASGYASAILTNRVFQGSMNPEVIAEGLFPLMGNAFDKASSRMLTIVGPQSGNGNTTVFRARQTQFGNPSASDREKLATYDVPLFFTGTNQDEFFILVF